jgi:hypothetical protein
MHTAIRGIGVLFVEVAVEPQSGERGRSGMTLIAIRDASGCEPGLIPIDGGHCRRQP